MGAREPGSLLRGRSVRGAALRRDPHACVPAGSPRWRTRRLASPRVDTPFPAGRASGAAAAPHRGRAGAAGLPVPAEDPLPGGAGGSGQGQAGANPRFRGEAADPPPPLLLITPAWIFSPFSLQLRSPVLRFACCVFPSRFGGPMGEKGGSRGAAPRMASPPPSLPGPARGVSQAGVPAGCCAGADVAQRRGVSHLCAGALPPPPRPAPCVVLSYSWIWFNNRSNFALPPPFFFP